jgi:alkylation response protein AidB-like acyl-CoA dehydrogenase
VSAFGLFDSEWYDGMTAVLVREWSEADAQSVLGGAGGDRVEDAWAAICAADFPGAGVPVAQGGSGLGLGPVLEIAAAAGAALFPTRLAFEALLPTLVLARLAKSESIGVLLGEIAAGKRVAVGIDSDGPGGPVFVHGAGGERGVDLCLVVRREPAAVIAVEIASLPEVTELKVLDGRQLGLVDLADAVGDVLAEGDAAQAAVRDARWLGALLAAADAVGAGATVLGRAVLYAGQRCQFGVPIGSFQAVKHALVDRFLDLQIGRALLAAASEGEELDPVAAAMAKAGINEAAVRAADTAIQVHGAVGFTAELGLHLYQRRVLTDRELFAGTGPSLALVRQSLGVEHRADLRTEPLETGAWR